MPFEPRLFGPPDEDPSHGRSDDCVAPEAEFAEPPDAPVWNDADALELPDDLAQLAEQLRDDASYLAERHPADATPQQRETAWRDYVDSDAQHSDAQQCATKKRPWRWVSVAAALVIIVSCCGYYFARGMQTSSPMAATEGPRFDRLSTDLLDSHARDNVDSLAYEGLPPENFLYIEEKPATVTELPDEQPRLIPAAFIRDVTGPELDGMLDLLEQDESGLSI